MKINLNNGSINIDLSSEYTGTNHVYKIYVDNINNENITSTADEHHTVVFQEDQAMDELFDLDVTEYKLSAAVITIFIHDDKDQSDTSIMKFIYDEEFLYYEVLNMVLNTCNHCLKRTEKERIVMVNMCWELFKYAIKYELINDSIKRYKDLIRILGIDDNPCEKYVNAEARPADFLWNGGTITSTGCNGNSCRVCTPCGSCGSCNKICKADAPLHRWIDVE